MPDTISKQTIKEAVVEALEPFGLAIQNDFKKVDERFDKVDGRLDVIDGRLDKVEGRLNTIESELSEVKSDVKWMKDNSSAVFTKLDKYIFADWKNGYQD